MRARVPRHLVVLVGLYFLATLTGLLHYTQLGRHLLLPTLHPA
jgi:hypothetical protein